MSLTHTKGQLTAAGVAAALVALMLVTAGFTPFKHALTAKVAEKLELSDEQKEKIKGQMVEVEKKEIEINSKLKITQIELREIMDTPQPNLNRAMEKVEEMGALRTELQKVRVSSMVFFKGLLTPEQYDKFEKMKGTLGERMRARKQAQWDERGKRGMLAPGGRRGGMNMMNRPGMGANMPDMSLRGDHPGRLLDERFPGIRRFQFDADRPGLRKQERLRDPDEARERIRDRREPMRRRGDLEEAPEVDTEE